MKIECEQCGNCCPRDCRDLKESPDDPEKIICRNHANRIAPNVCDLPPIVWLSGGTACRAGIHVVLERLIPNLELDTFVDGNGITKFDMLKLTQETRDLISELNSEAKKQKYNLTQF